MHHRTRTLPCVPALLLGALAGAWTAAAVAADAPALCATAEQRQAVAPLYAQAPMPPPFMAAPKLGMPEAAVLSALPAERAVGTAGSAFMAVWESLQGWEDATTLVLKGGHVLEIAGRIPAGEMSKVSQFFNLKENGPGLGGHLRPDLVGAIYAVSIEGKEGPARGVEFLDARGDNAFSVFLPEARQPTPAQVAQFEKTRALIASLPRLCPAP